MISNGNPANAKGNLAKHGIPFEFAAMVFENPRAVASGVSDLSALRGERRAVAAALPSAQAVSLGNRFHGKI